MEEKPKGVKKIEKEWFPPPKSKLHLLRVTHIHKWGDVWRSTGPQGRATAAASQAPWVSPHYVAFAIFTVSGWIPEPTPVDNTRAEWGKGVILGHLSARQQQNPSIWLSWGINIFISLFSYCLLVSFGSVGSLSCSVLLIFSDNMDYWVWGKEQVYLISFAQCLVHGTSRWTPRETIWCGKKGIPEKAWFGRFWSFGRLQSLPEQKGHGSLLLHFKNKSISQTSDFDKKKKQKGKLKII